MEQLLECQSTNMNKNFDHLHEDINNFVKLMSGCNFPVQPFHSVDGHTPGKTLSEHVNDVTVLHSGKTIPKREDIVFNSKNAENLSEQSD